MAIPFEAAPATVFKESDIAEFGLALQDRQEAKETQKRERFEKAYKETNLPAWTQRDTAVMKYASAVRDLLLDPAIYNAKAGSPEHIRGLRAKEQLERVAAASGANKKRFEEEIDFLKNNPDAEGVDMLTAYHDMPFDGEVVIDEYGNGLVDGEPIITHPALSSPPSLRKREKGVNLEDVWGGTTMGQYTTPDGIVAVPSRGEARAFLERKFGGMPDKDKYLKSYIEGKYLQEYGMMPARGYAESIISNAPDELMESFIDEMTQQHLELYKSGGKVSDGDGKRGGLLGEFDKKSFVKIEPQFGVATVAEGTEFKSGVSVPTVKFVSTLGGSEGDVAEIIHADKVSQDKDGNLYVSGKKYTGDIKKLIGGNLASPDGSGGFSIDPSATGDLLGTLGWKSKTLEPMKLEGTDASSFVAAMKIQGVNSVDQFKKAMDDFYGVTAEPTQQVTEVEVEENKKKEGDMTDEEYEQFLKDNGLK